MDEKGIDDLVIWYYGKDQYMIEEFPLMSTLANSSA